MKEKNEAVLDKISQSEPLVLFDRIALILYFVLLLLSMTVTTGRISVILTAGSLLLTICYILTVGRRNLSVFRQNLSVPVFGFLCFALMNGFAAIYSDFGSYAVSEFNKFLASFAITALMLFCFQKKYTNTILWGMSSISAAIGLLGVDAAANGPVFGIFQKLMLTLGTDYSYVNKEPFSGRLNGIYNDSNVTAAILALGCILSLYLIIKESTVRKRLLASLLLGCSSVSFLMSVSRGAMLCFAFALLIWILASTGKNRIHLFILIVISAISTICFSAAIFSCLADQSVSAVLLTLLCGPVIFILDWVVGERLAVFLGKHMAAAVVLFLFFIISAICFSIAAITFSGPLTLPAAQWVPRTVSLLPGNYSLSGDWDDDVYVRVYTNSDLDTLTFHNSLSYEGKLDDCAFTVSDDTTTVMLDLIAPNGSEIRSLSVSNGTPIRLGYPLLPASISNRLQDGLFHGYSVLQRTQYIRDSFKLITASSFLGHGLGSTEGLYTSVQPYFYQSLFAHNHILQVLCDMGLVGAVFFLTMMLGVAWFLIRRLMKEHDLLASMLLACWIMINTHSLMEINFSIRGYQCFVYPLLMLTAMLYAPPIRDKAAKAAGIIGAAAIWLFMGVFGGLMESHRIVQRQAAELSTSDPYFFMKKMERFIRKDVFDNEQFKLNYVANAPSFEDPSIQENMVRYAESLRDSGTYTACSGLARYYYLPQGDLDNLFACSREGIAQEASAKEAWNLQLSFYRSEVVHAVTPDNYDSFISGVLATKAYLDEYSQDHWEEIVIEEENQTFLNLIQSLHDESVDAEIGIMILAAQ